MTTAVITSSTTNNNNNVSTVTTASVISNEQLGEAIKSLTANDIASIAEKMSEIFSQGAKIPSGVLTSNKTYFTDSEGRILGKVYFDAKTDFVRRAQSLFEQDMKNDFQMGSFSCLVDKNGRKYSWRSVNDEDYNNYNNLISRLQIFKVNDGYEYCYGHILQFAVNTGGGGYALRKAVGFDQSHGEYRIKLSLDKEQTQAKGQLVFTIIETNEGKELSRTSVHMKDTPPFLIE